MPARVLLDERALNCSAIICPAGAPSSHQGHAWQASSCRNRIERPMTPCPSCSAGTCHSKVRASQDKHKLGEHLPADPSPGVCPLGKMGCCLPPPASLTPEPSSQLFMGHFSTQTLSDHTFSLYSLPRSEQLFLSAFLPYCGGEGSLWRSNVGK